MTRKYFNVDVIPDIVDGDISEAFGDIAGGDIVFDWTAVDVPKGSCMLRSVAAYVNAEDGAYGAGSLTDYELLFAKSIKGVAPPTIGATNAVQTGCGALRHHFIGGVRLESEAGKGTLTKTTLGVVYLSGQGGTQTATAGSKGYDLVVDLDPISGTHVGYDKLYVAGLQVSARNYNTNVLADGGVTASSAQSKTITVKTTDATLLFSPGDQVYVMDLDTPIPGNLTKVEATTLTFDTANTTVDITDGDELINANPIRIRLGFEK